MVNGIIPSNLCKAKFDMFFSQFLANSYAMYFAQKARIKILISEIIAAKIMLKGRAREYCAYTT